MPIREGVIQFYLDFREGPAPDAAEIAAINAWRRQLFRIGLIGQDPARYGGLGYGNVSVRCGEGFLITGTQTGGLPELGPEHFTRVVASDPAANAVTAVGPIRPSSEALTHASLYACDARIGCVLHVHAPRMWQAADALGLPATRRVVPYGTPEMAAEMARLHADPAARGLRVFVMKGHEDGLVAFGATPDEAGGVLLAVHARAQTEVRR